VFFPQYQASEVDDKADQNPYVTESKRLVSSRINAKRNFLGMDFSTEDGVWHADIDKSTWVKDQVEWYEKGAQTKRLVNIEGKNFILKVQNEVAEKLKNWKPHGHGEGHGAHH